MVCRTGQDVLLCFHLLYPEMYTCGIIMMSFVALHTESHFYVSNVFSCQEVNSLIGVANFIPDFIQHILDFNPTS